VREILKFAKPKLSDLIQRVGKPPKIAPKPQKCLFAFSNFGIANLERKNETTKFKNENFKICNYIFHKMTIFTQSQK
jgi:hypothetical protein